MLIQVVLLLFVLGYIFWPQIIRVTQRSAAFKRAQRQALTSLTADLVYTEGCLNPRHEGAKVIAPYSQKECLFYWLEVHHKPVISIGWRQVIQVSDSVDAVITHESSSCEVALKHLQRTSLGMDDFGVTHLGQRGMFLSSHERALISQLNPEESEPGALGHWRFREVIFEPERQLYVLGECVALNRGAEGPHWRLEGSERQPLLCSGRPLEESFSTDKTTLLILLGMLLLGLIASASFSLAGSL